METDQKSPTYRVWGTDKVIYGPVDLPTLVNWTKQGRLSAEAWVFCDAEDRWQKAAEVPELKMFLAARPQPGQTTGFQAAARPAINPASLRRIKALAGLDQTQLASFLQYVQVVSCRQFSHVVRKGEHGDAMYLVLEGELRALTIVDGKQTTLATMRAGDFFGEISLLDQAPRSADVVANQDSTLLKVSVENFERLVAEAPALALPFLLAISRVIVGRVRSLTKRYEDSLHFAHFGFDALAAGRAKVQKQA